MTKDLRVSRIDARRSVKELSDNIIDGCESARSPILPHLTIEIDDHAIAVQDNGPALDPPRKGIA